MSNSIAINTLVAKNGLDAMFNKLQFFRLVDRQLDSQWAKDVNGYAPGMSYQINRQARLQATAGVNIGASASEANGLVYDTQAFIEDPITFTLVENDQAKIPLQFSTQEKTLALGSNESDLGSNAGKTMAGFLEKKIISETVAKSGGNILLTGDITVADVLAAQARLDELATPTEDRSFLLPPVVMAQLSKEHQTLFTPDSNTDIAVSGYIKEYAGSKLFSYNMLPKYTVPAYGAAVMTVSSVTSAQDDAATFSIESDIAVTLPAGTLLEFNGKYLTNPETGDATGTKYSFAITSQLVLTGSNSQQVSIDPAAKIYGPDDLGNRQNIDVYPAVNDVINVVGVSGASYHQALMFQKDAYTATCIPLTTDLDGASVNRSDYDGFSVRTCSQVAIGSGSMITRFDAMAKGILQRDLCAVRILIPV